MTFEVIDTIRNLTDADIALMKSLGITGVSRYIARTSSIGKIMRRPECDRILASGLALMVNYEQSAGDWQGGYARGKVDGQWARSYVRGTLGLPDSVVIIQSIDTSVADGNPSAAEVTAAAYQRGFNDGGGLGPQGVYGPRNVLEYIHSLGLCSVCWEWMGFKGAASSPVSHIRQFRDKPYPQLPFTYDANTPIKPYYGQHPAPGAPIPGPIPPPAHAQGDDVAVAISAADGDPTGQLATFAWQPGCSIGWLTSDTQLAVGKVTGTLVFDGAGNPLKNFGHAEIQDFINRYWAGGPVPPSFTAPPSSPSSGLDAGTVNTIVREQLDRTLWQSKPPS